MADQNKYLFGKVPVVLTPDPDGKAGNYVLKKEVSPIEKSNLLDGMLYVLDISYADSTILPKVENTLKRLTQSPSETDLTLEFRTTYLFEKFSGVITDYTAAINIKTEQDILSTSKK